MTLGTGIFWSTVLVLLAAGIYFISVRKKWRAVGKVLAVLVLLSLLVAGATWGWYWYQNRPQVTTELAGVRLGMKPVDVTLAKGVPTYNEDPTDTGKEFTAHWGYGGRRDGESWIVDSGDNYTLIRFSGDKPETIEVGIVCRSGGISENLLGFGKFDREQDILEKLGEPTTISIDLDGTAKIISYKRWNVAYQLEQGRVTEICITTTGWVKFLKEYGDVDDG